MSDGAGDPVMQAAARLEAAVARLADALPAALARARAPLDAAGMVPRAEVAALAARLDATIARLRGVVQDDMRQPEDRGEEE
jgi:hypothetical protein